MALLTTSSAAGSAGQPGGRSEDAVSGTDLMVIVPWAVFAAGVITITVLGFTSGRRRPCWLCRRRGGKPPKD
jgi:hypothetical protein